MSSELSESDFTTLGFTPKPTFPNLTSLVTQAAAFGTIFGSGRIVYHLAVNSPTPYHGLGLGPTLARTGFRLGMIGRDTILFAIAGAAYSFAETTVAQTRQKNDALNSVAAGCAAGFVAGIRGGSIPGAIGGCAALGAVMGTYDYSGELSKSTPESRAEKKKNFFKKPPPPPEPQDSE